MDKKKKKGVEKSNLQEEDKTIAVGRRKQASSE